MTTTGQNGRTYGLGFRRGRERPEKWQFELKPPTAVDRTQVRSLAKFMLQPPFDQGDEGSCTANSGCLAAMACAAIDGVAVPTLSRSWMYYQERVMLGTFPEDSGADVIDEYDVDAQVGNIADSVWPYDANPSEPPPASAASAQRYQTVAAYQPIAAGSQATIDAILTALDHQQPVVIGLLWWDAFTEAYDQGAVVTPALAAGQPVGGHALTVKGWAPPSAAHPNGVVILQGSWGQNSPAQTSLWADAKAGDHYFDASLFTATVQGQLIISDVYAAVPLAAPATLSVSVTPPASATAGQPCAWSATVTGLPAGSQAVFAWTFAQAGQPTGAAKGPQVTFTPAAAGTLTATCAVTVATTGAGATGSASVTVQPAANPSPQPSPAPSPGPGPGPTCQTEVDRVFSAELAAITAAQPPGDVLVTVPWYATLTQVTTWNKTNVDAALAPPAQSPLALPGISAPPPPRGAA